MTVPYLLVKYLVTAGVVVLVSELARRSDKLGALVASLPLVTVLTLVWLYAERQPAERIANHAWYTFWYVLPTLPMFLAFPWLMQRYGFGPALGGLVLGSLLLFAVYARIVSRFGIQLL